MTVTNSNAKNSYVANGSEVAFTYAFKIYSATDIIVYVNDVIVTNYTVAGVKNETGGSIVFSTAPSLNSRVAIIRNEPLTQQINIGFGDNNPSEQYEEGLDRSVYRDQKLNEAIDRCLKLSPNSVANATLPTPQGGYLFGWNATGTAIVNYASTTELATVDRVTTIATLRNTEPTTTGQIVFLLGHTTAGVGGGLFRADLSDTTTSDDGGIVIVTTGGKRWKRIIENGFIDSDMYNGDVTALLPNATTKYAMKLMSDYSLSSIINLNKSDITIDCNGFRLIPNQTTAGLQIWGDGETGDFSNLASDMSIGSNTFVVTASYNIGDYVFIKSTATLPSPNVNGNQRGQIFKLTNKNSFVNEGVTYYTYKTDCASEYDFTQVQSANSTKHVMLKNVVIDNFYLNEENYSQQFTIGLNFKNIVNLTINNPIGIGSKTKYGSDVSGRSFIKINNCINVTINNAQANHIGWYGIEILGACRNIKINGGYGHDCRHAVSINWLDSGHGEPIDVKIYDFIADRCTLSGLDSHDRGLRIKWVNCVSRYSVADSGFQQRANISFYEGCIAYGNALHGFAGRNSLTARGNLVNCEAYSNLYSGFVYDEFGANILNCKSYANGDSGFYVSSGNINGGSSTGNQWSVRVPYISTDDNILTVSGLYATANTGGNGNHVYFENMTNYNVERAIFNSCILTGFSQTPFVGSPSGNKDGQFPLTNGYNKLTTPSATKNRLKGLVTLSSGTARVSVPVHRYISTTSTPLSVKDKIILSVRTASSAGALRYVLDTSEAYFDIFSTNSSDASVIEWEITGC